MLAIAWIAAALGCSRPDDTRIHYDDITTLRPLTSSAGQKRALSLTCEDETRQVLLLRPDELNWAPLEAGRDAELVVSGCSIPSPGADAKSPLRLEIVLEFPKENRRNLTYDLPIPSRATWWKHKIDLGDKAVGATRIKLRARMPDGGKFFLRDLHLRHRVPGPPSRKSANSQARQILLISVDTLREDAIAALGGGEPTPVLDGFLAQSEVFSPHYAAANWTKPSHASLLTGFSPLVHGATDFEKSIHPGLPSLAGRFRDAGFRTAGLVYDCVQLDSRFGFAKGFDEYQSVRWELPQMVRQAINWIGEHRGESFFYFFHTYEVHSDFRFLPYEAPGVGKSLVQRRFGVANYGCTGGLCATMRLAKIRSKKLPPIPREAEILRYLYGRGVAHLDEELGVLFDDLRALGMFDQMLIVVTSDHGEAFFEHDDLLHGANWNEVLRVPLVIKWPAGRRAGLRSELNSNSLDVAPTLLAAAGIETSDLPGIDLGDLPPDVPSTFPSTSLPTSPSKRPVFSGISERVVMLGRYKAHFGVGGAQLFDLEADPGEEHDLGEEQSEILQQLRSLSDAELREAQQSVYKMERRTAPAPLSEDERKRLQALGYLDVP